MSFGAMECMLSGGGRGEALSTHGYRTGNAGDTRVPVSLDTHALYVAYEVCQHEGPGTGDAGGTMGIPVEPKNAMDAMRLHTGVL